MRKESPENVISLFVVGKRMQVRHKRRWKTFAILSVKLAGLNTNAITDQPNQPCRSTHPGCAILSINRRLKAP
jgi:hypothetical protein